MKRQTRLVDHVPVTWEEIMYCVKDYKRNRHNYTDLDNSQLQDKLDNLVREFRTMYFENGYKGGAK